MGRRIFTKEYKDELVQKYVDGMSGEAIMKKYNVSSAIFNWVRERGLTRSNKQNSRRYNVNHDFFEIIDTEEKAYWLGFLYADGCVTSSGAYRIALALGRKDEEHLHLFKKHLNAEYPVRQDQAAVHGALCDYSRIAVTSEKMYEDLVSKGVYERKSLILTFPGEEIVPQHLQHHFIRGYFDGDGSFSKCSAKFGFTIKICGTKEFLMTLQTIINYHTKLSKRHDDGKNTWSLEIGKQSVILNFANTIYNNATIYLPRKYERYKQILKQSS